MTTGVHVEIAENAEAVALLQLVQRAVFEHPIAAQAAFAALVAEGRAFAKTAEGAAWQERLLGSALLEKAEALWEGVTLNVLEENADTLVPSRILDVLVKLLHEHALDTVLAKLHRSVG
jgi:hypothetical protein